MEAFLDEGDSDISLNTRHIKYVLKLILILDHFCLFLMLLILYNKHHMV